MQQPFGERPASDGASALAAVAPPARDPHLGDAPGATVAATAGDASATAGESGRTEAGEPGEAAGGMAQARESVVEAEPEDYDPWEPYNERMFAFNYNVDRYVLKPVANVYRHIMPEPFQLMIANGFDNIRYPARLVNHILQGRFWGAFIETSRFVINTTLGFGGVFNPATDYFGIEKSRADFGQTLHRWGVGPGPFFVPPFLPPATVRDFIGRLADSAMNPISWYLLDFWPEAFAIGTGEMVNERAVNYELFQGVEETTLDLYTAVRDGYLRRRERQLRLDVD
jgi:phospholipid-binding lipoprotein MlaA